MSESESPVTNGAAGPQESPGSHMSRTPEQSINGDPSDADLFGDNDDDASIDQPEKLDDSELDSGDDEERKDRLAETIEEDEDEPEGQQREQKIALAEISRIKPPEGDEMFLLNMPSFLGLAQRAYNPEKFEAPTHPHGVDPDETTSQTNFSAFNTAMSTVRWRHDPKKPERLQSNARIIRWSDGSLTLQLATSPKDQYRISTQALRQSFDKKNKKHHLQTDYDPNKDAQVYLAAHHVEASLTQIVAPIDAALKILPTGDQEDEALIKLQQSLAANMNVHDPLSVLKDVKEDPELAKKAAELFEKDRLRSVRRRENAEARLLSRRERVLGGVGLGRGGLSVAGLEDEDGMMASSGARKKAKRRKTNRRGIIYSDDEEEGVPRGRTKEDQYDEDDGFLVASDEEPEVFDSGNDEEPEAEEEDDPDVDDLEIEGHQTLLESSTRGGERDRNRLLARSGGDMAKGTPTVGESRSRSRGATPPGRHTDTQVGQGSPQAGRKKRRVIDDDDDE